MPMFTYTPAWDAIKTWYERFEGLIPENYTGLIGIRLHRTGQPLSFEFMGKTLPDEPVYPMLVIKMSGGELSEDWDKIQDRFDVPWPRESDFHYHRDEVMRMYHAEDLLEPAAEAILENERPNQDLLKAALIDQGDAVL